ncbi:MAG: ATP-binding cassette, subfamily B, bacterial [Parcubacteria group bacterium Athens0714_16]|nr:MAG: ATP-binding cassette, subfamily B, bacterial [Parcubacteria group bacterium Athens0714_16]
MGKEEKKEKISFLAIEQMIENTIRLLKVVWIEKKKMMIVLFSIFIVISATPFLKSGSNGLLINELVNVTKSGEPSSSLFWLIALVISSNLLPSFLYTIEGYINKVFWFFLEEKFEFMIIEKKGQIDVATHESPNRNDLFSKINEGGTWRLRNFIDRQFYIIQGLIEVIIASIIIMSFNWWVFLIVLIGSIPDFVIEMQYGKEVWSIQDSKAETKRRYWDIRGHFSRVSSIVELKLFQNANHFLKIIKELFQNFRQEEKKNEQKMLRKEIFAMLLAQSVMTFAIVWFIFEVVNGKIQIGTFTFVIASIGTLRNAFSGLFRNMGRQYQDSLFVTDVFKFLDIKPEIEKPKMGIILDKNKTPEIIFENVTFSYPNTKKKVLKNFSVKIPAGSKMAIVGVNGAGKTTFVKLLCRFYDPDEGRILIGGYNLKDIDLESWYYQLGAIFQDYSNYHFLVKESIAIGRVGKESDIEKVKEAAKSSEADIFIEEWEKNYEQMLGKEFSDGVQPSIGQWQKLALARTFYRDPRILILDEPTSSIDAEAEAKIFEKLEFLPKDRTVILISHRFSTVRHADKIIVIKSNTVTESGSHEELLFLNGTYAKLFKLQAKGYK